MPRPIVLKCFESQTWFQPFTRGSLPIFAPNRPNPKSFKIPQNPSKSIKIPQNPTNRSLIGFLHISPTALGSPLLENRHGAPALPSSGPAGCPAVGPVPRPELRRGRAAAAVDRGRGTGRSRGSGYSGQGGRGDSLGIHPQGAHREPIG